MRRGRERALGLLSQGRRPATFRKQGLNDAPLEIFGGQETLVEWRRGRVELGRQVLEPAVLAWCGPWRGAAEEGGIYLGLIKHRQPVVRPTTLEQAQAESIRVDLRDPEQRPSPFPRLDRPSRARRTPCL